MQDTWQNTISKSIEATRSALACDDAAPMSAAVRISIACLDEAMALLPAPVPLEDWEDRESPQSEESALEWARDMQAAQLEQLARHGVMIPYVKQELTRTLGAVQSGLLPTRHGELLEKAIIVWQYKNAPEQLKALAPGAHDQAWVAWVPHEHSEWPPMWAEFRNDFNGDIYSTIKLAGATVTIGGVFSSMRETAYLSELDPPAEMREAANALAGKLPELLADAFLVWAFYDAPDDYQILSRHGGDEDWVAYMPPHRANEEPDWMREGSTFGCCSVSRRVIPNGGVIAVGAHA